MFGLCLERIRYENQGVVALAKLFYCAFGGSNKQ